jgi:3-methyl-2-oxobutanoate hydroxymethyltransferase
MSTGPEPAGARSTVLTFQQKKGRGERLSVLTAFDFPTARLLDAAGVDGILVGDSLAMVALGHETTLPVTMEEMLHHARAVARGATRALLVGDMPFLSYQAEEAEAVRNAGRFLQAGMHAVKVEGGRDYAGTVRALGRAGIPVMGHVGLMPQSVRRLGGYRPQGRTAESARTLLDDALALEAAGCFSIVLESVPEKVAAAITAELRVPTIGIGAGRGTDGQVLVTHDMLGLHEPVPRFVRRYAHLGDEILRAVRAYRDDVESGRFPDAEHAPAMPEEEWGAFLATLGPRPSRTPGR